MNPGEIVAELVCAALESAAELLPWRWFVPLLAAVVLVAGLLIWALLAR
jgi:hypothetical protein